MLEFTKYKYDCTGCGACMAVCPKHCISMQKDEEGFLYPVASDSCVHCGKCERACPVQKNILDRNTIVNQEAWCALSKSKEVWSRSASGGGFSELCRAFGDENTVFCGAAWDGFRVHHICVEGFDAIKPLCKSKYVASDTENVFLEIKQYLKNGKKVVFCGTPCQVAGLRSVLGLEENILYIDLICHGVGSPDVFGACMQEIGDQFGGRVISYEFRTKRGSFEADHQQKIDIADGRQLFLENDPYIQLFLRQICLRPSCGKHCRFRCEQRQGDVTIADFKGLTNIFPNLIGSKRNYSTIVLHTNKARNLLPELKKNMTMYPCTIEDIKKYNPLYYRQTWFAENRDVFFQNFINDPKNTIELYTEPTKVLKLNWKRKIWMCLPQVVRRMLIKHVIGRRGYF